MTDEEIVNAAREAAASVWNFPDDEHIAAEFRAGLRDESGSVKSAIAAIRADREKRGEPGALIARAAEEIACKVDEVWRERGGINCTEVCAIIRAYGVTTVYTAPPDPAQGSYRSLCLSMGACPSCIDGATESFGCWDCQNTGWSGGAPHARIAELEAAIDSAETASGATSGGNLWRFWARMAATLSRKNAALTEQRDTALAAMQILDDRLGEAERVVTAAIAENYMMVEEGRKHEADLVKRTFYHGVAAAIDTLETHFNRYKKPAAPSDIRT